MILLIVGGAPVFSQDVLRDVDSDLAFQAVQRNPDNFKGKTTLLGGRIIEITPLQDKTRMTLLQLPLGYGTDIDEIFGKLYSIHKKCRKLKSEKTEAKR